MTTRDAVQKWLKKIGADGMVFPGGVCSCETHEIEQCCWDCVPAKWGTADARQAMILRCSVGHRILVEMDQKGPKG